MVLQEPEFSVNISHTVVLPLGTDKTALGGETTPEPIPLLPSVQLRCMTDYRNTLKGSQVQSRFKVVDSPVIHLCCNGTAMNAEHLLVCSVLFHISDFFQILGDEEPSKLFEDLILF
ncbi:hypothetical protein CEXT_395961 [Caerostris extrusa]|uniref:Uncharacterized protein n=1 Tax=Caerostris extrusa TaxID=172846 RepID=A0AAV4U377_CAEEX|nr:hypothetical protein CEXT_395961 [Caerostris extrusa]